MNTEPTNQDILEAVHSFATSTETRLQNIESSVSSLDNRVGHLENQMVTKEYLDEKLSDLRGDLVVLLRKEDKKVAKLIEILQNNNVISQDDAKQVLSLEPFPQQQL